MSRARVVFARVAGIGSFGAAAFGVLLAVVFYSIEFGDSLACSDLPLGPVCAHSPDSCCARWGPPSSLGEWSPWVAVQAIILAVIVLAATVSWRCLHRCVSAKSRQATSSAHFLVAAWLVLIGVALFIDLAVYIHFWSDWKSLPSDYRADSSATFGRAMVEGVSVVVLLVAAAAWGVFALYVRPAYRKYVQNHKGQPLSPKTMRRIAGALVMTAVFGAAYFGSFAVLGRLGHDARSVPCLDAELWRCYEYSPPSDGWAWLWVVIAQVIALTGMLVFLGLACAPFRGREPRARVVSRIGPRVVRIAWMIGVVVTVIVDLAVYIGQRIDWGNL